MSETNELRQAAQKALKAMSYYPVTVNHWKLVLLPAAEALRAALEKEDEPMPRVNVTEKVAPTSAASPAA